MNIQPFSQEFIGIMIFAFVFLLSIIISTARKNSDIQKILEKGFKYEELKSSFPSQEDISSLGVINYNEPLMLENYIAFPTRIYKKTENNIEITLYDATIRSKTLRLRKKFPHSFYGLVIKDKHLKIPEINLLKRSIVSRKDDTKERELLNSLCTDFGEKYVVANKADLSSIKNILDKSIAKEIMEHSDIISQIHFNNNYIGWNTRGMISSLNVGKEPYILASLPSLMNIHKAILEKQKKE